MKKNIVDVKPKDLQLIKNILRKHLPQHAVVWIFGSRATHKAKPFSDLDLAIDVGTSISQTLIANLAFDFEESDLPYKVDIVDWHTIDDSFRKCIEKEKLILHFLQK